jgi:hypothetical protein
VPPVKNKICSYEKYFIQQISGDCCSEKGILYAIMYKYPSEKFVIKLE